MLTIQFLIEQSWSPRYSLRHLCCSEEILCAAGNETRTVHGENRVSSREVSWLFVQVVALESQPGEPEPTDSPLNALGRKIRIYHASACELSDIDCRNDSTVFLKSVVWVRLLHVDVAVARAVSVRSPELGSTNRAHG